MAKAMTAVLATLVLVANARTADACSPLDAYPFFLTEGLRDATPPVLGDITATVGRDYVDRGECDEVATFLHLEVEATDAEARSYADIGYVVRVLRGNVVLPAWPYVPPNELASLRFRLDIEHPWIDADLEVVAVDRAGNASTPRIVRLVETPSDPPGCSASGAGHTVPVTSVALVLVVFARPRRRMRA